MRKQIEIWEEEAERSEKMKGNLLNEANLSTHV